LRASIVPGSALSHGSHWDRVAGGGIGWPNGLVGAFGATGVNQTHAGGAVVPVKAVARQTLCCSVTLIPFVESAEYLGTGEVVEIGEGGAGAVFRSAARLMVITSGDVEAGGGRSARDLGGLQLHRGQAVAVQVRQRLPRRAAARPAPLTAPAPIAAQATGSQQSQSNRLATLEWCPVRRPSRGRLSADHPARKPPGHPAATGS
jgi:hypothetical protein